MPRMSDVFILSSARTPIGKFGGGLSTVPATQLGAIAIRAAVERSGVAPEKIDEVFMGQVIQAGAGQAPARQAALGAGLPNGVGATTINKVCGSGLKAVMLGAASIRAGDAAVIVAGGMENMNLGPYLLPGARAGYRLGNAEVVDATVHDGLWCAICDVHMGIHAERVAAKHEVSRDAQDEFAVRSHERALAAIAGGRFADEIVPVEVPGRKGEVTVVDIDEHPRPDTSLEALARLRPAFREGGSVTAGNAAGLNDGAAALVVASEDYAREHGLTPRARVVASAVAGVPPRVMGIGPVPAVRKVLTRASLTVEDLDLVELNEAFASQVLASIRELGLDGDRVNVNGGAIAIGHPLGSTGARLITTLLHELERSDKETGLVTMCCGGGLGTGTLIQRV